MLDEISNILIYLSKIKDVREHIPLFVKGDQINFELVNLLFSKNNYNSSSNNSPTDVESHLSLNDTNNDSVLQKEEIKINSQTCPATISIKTPAQDQKKGTHAINSANTSSTLLDLSANK